MLAFFTTAIGKVVAKILAAVAFVGGLIAYGYSRAKSNEKKKDLKEYKETRENIDDAPTFDNDADAARSFLRNRKRTGPVRRDEE